MAGLSPLPAPAVLLILGTDLAGKNYAANLLADLLTGEGLTVERRQGAFAARPSAALTSEDKGIVRLWAERLFLASLPLHRLLLPVVVDLLLRRDLHHFRPPAAGARVIVISHTALRLLALYLGCRDHDSAALRLPSFVVRTLRAVTPRTGARTVVLDIDHATRRQRLANRQGRGKADPFDRYMAADEGRAERIESCLVRLAVEFLGARRVENNGLEAAALMARLRSALEL